MKLNNDGYRLITKFEGFSSKPYLCPAKIPTIGYGSTYYSDNKRVTMLDKEITEQEGFNLFKTIADKFAKAVSNVITQPLNQNQFNACVSLCYNIGVANLMNSTLLKVLNKDCNNKDIALEFKKWNKVNKKEVKGLTKRREYEAVIYFS